MMVGSGRFFVGAGLVLGLLAGGVMGVTLADTCPGGASRCAGRPASTPVVMVTAGLLGIVGGACIGALLGRGPVWHFASR